MPTYTPPIYHALQVRKEAALCCWLATAGGVLPIVWAHSIVLPIVCAHSIVLPIVWSPYHQRFAQHDAGLRAMPVEAVLRALSQAVKRCSARAGSSCTASPSRFLPPPQNAAYVAWINKDPARLCALTAMLGAAAAVHLTFRAPVPLSLIRGTRSFVPDSATGQLLDGSICPELAMAYDFLAAPLPDGELSSPVIGRYHACWRLSVRCIFSGVWLCVHLCDEFSMMNSQ